LASAKFLIAELGQFAKFGDALLRVKLSDIINAGSGADDIFFLRLPLFATVFC
jgi:hypothetical protein